MPVLQADRYAEIELPDIPEWDPMSEQGGLKIDATIVACGKRRTGKSWAFRNLMFLLKDKLPAGIVSAFLSQEAKRFPLLKLLKVRLLNW